MRTYVRYLDRNMPLSLLGVVSVAFVAGVAVSRSQTHSPAQQPATGAPQSPATQVVTSPQGGVAGSVASPFGAQAQPNGLNIVVLDPARGGTDPGARGTRGFRAGSNGLEFVLHVL